MKHGELCRVIQTLHNAIMEVSEREMNDEVLKYVPSIGYSPDVYEYLLATTATITLGDGRQIHLVNNNWQFIRLINNI